MQNQITKYNLNTLSERSANENKFYVKSHARLLIYKTWYRELLHPVWSLPAMAGCLVTHSCIIAP